MKLWLTVVEYSEVFFELSAQKVWGAAGKWRVIVAVQIFKYVTCSCGFTRSKFFFLGVFQG